MYEKGYGKDAAGIAMEAINYARMSKIDVVLVDTAGRMQVRISSLFRIFGEPFELRHQTVVFQIEIFTIKGVVFYNELRIFYELEC